MQWGVSLCLKTLFCPCLEQPREESGQTEVHGEPTQTWPVCHSTPGGTVRWELGRRLRIHRSRQV